MRSLRILLAAALLAGGASRHSHVEYDLVFREKASLGMQLSQDLHVLSFVARSVAQVRGVKAGDRLVAVNAKVLVDDGDAGAQETQKNKAARATTGLAKLSMVLRSLPWPRTFRFRRAVQGGGEAESDGDAKGTVNVDGSSNFHVDDDDSGNDSSVESAFISSNDRRRRLPSGESARRFSVVFSRNERIGIHFAANLTIIGFARGSDGTIRAAERSGLLRRGDVLLSVNGDVSEIDSMLATHRYPALSIVRYLDHLRPPIVLHFVRRVDVRRRGMIYSQQRHGAATAAPSSSASSRRDASASVRSDTDPDMGSVFTDPDEWRRHHLGAAKSGRQLTADEAEKVHRGQHIDIALAGNHHRHDAGDYSHHTVNAFRIMQAEFGPAPSCERRRLVATNPLHACGNLQHPHTLKDAFAVVIRGQCNFIDKARAVEAAGARGMVLINTGGAKLVRMPGALFGMADDSSDVKIPSVMVEASAYALVAEELVADRPEVMTTTTQWTGRIVGAQGCRHDEAGNTRARRQPVQKEEEARQARDIDRRASGGYIVGHDGQAMYRERRRGAVMSRGGADDDGSVLPAAAADAPTVKSGVLVFMPPIGEMSLATLPMDVEYMLAEGGGTVMPEYSTALLMSDKDACQAHAEPVGNDNVRPLLLMPLKGGGCSMLQKAVRAQRRGAAGVVFLTEETMLHALVLEGAQEGDGTVVSIPVVSTVAGDARRVALAMAKWGKADKPIHTHAWANRLVAQSWATYEKLDDYANWPHDTESRRRFVHRLLRSAGKSVPQREAIVAAAARAEAAYGRIRRNEL